jgi:CelD/BcsL family acetyltransferase involved in cellulose biosynthesis
VKVDVLTRPEDLVTLRPAWDALAQTDLRDGLFRTSAWCLPWMEHIQPEAQPFVVVVHDDEGALLGVAPLCKLKYRDHGLSLNALSSAGREVVSGDFLDYIALPSARAQVYQAILDFLWEQRSEWELLVIGEVAEGGDLHHAVQAFSDKEELPLRTQEERVCPYIELPRTFEDYLRTISQKMRYEIRRDTRDLEKAGAQIEVFTEPQKVSENLHILIELHLAHWQRVNQPGNMGRRGFPEFLRQFCAEPPAGACPRLYILKYDQKPAAAVIVFWFGENVSFYQTGWDPDSQVARLSPGMVLVARSIKDAIENEFRYYDFLRGDETYKCRLTKASRRTVTLLLARSFLAKKYLDAARLKDLVKRALTSDGALQAALQGAPDGK